jgi:DNA polymerase-3 subunit epsilon
LTLLDRLAGRLGLVRGSELEPRLEEGRPPPPPPALPGMDFVVIDVETACARASSICQIGIVGFSEGREVLAWESLVDPQDVFATFNIRLHGIGAAHVRGKPRFPQLHHTLTRHLGGRITVAHSNFDQGALRAACRVAGLPAIQTRWLDSVQVARHAWPELPSHRLNLLADHLGLEHRHHDALSDARVAGWVLVRAMEHTGLDLDAWLAGPWRGTTRGPERSAPEPAATGALAGLRVGILGEPRDGPLARTLAAAGARIVGSMGAKTELLVVPGVRPFAEGIERSSAYRRAEALIAMGQPLRIISAAEARDLIAEAAEASH